jgi:hypothetical protein
MSSLDKMVSSSKKKMSVSTSLRVSTTKEPEKITDAVILRNRFNAKVSSGALREPYSGVTLDEGKIRGATSLGISNFVGMNQPFQKVLFFKTPARFVIESRVYDSGRAHLLINNPDAKDVSIDELKAFVDKSSLALRRYSEGSFMCADFASRLHNKSEATGIRCGYVISVGINPSSGHAFNVFCALDKKGKPTVIFVDMTRKLFLTGSEYKRSQSKYIKEMHILV